MHSMPPGIIGITVSGDSEPPEWMSLATAAGGLLSGLNTLDTRNAATHQAHAFLSCHILECILKSLITYDTPDTSVVRRNDVRHNLCELWRMVAKRRCIGSLDAPEWVQALNFLHDRPYRMRYVPKIAGVAIPSPEPTHSELNRLMAIFEQLGRLG